METTHFTDGTDQETLARILTLSHGASAFARLGGAYPSASVPSVKSVVIPFCVFRDWHG